MKEENDYNVNKYHKSNVIKYIGKKEYDNYIIAEISIKEDNFNKNIPEKVITLNLTKNVAMKKK